MENFLLTSNSLSNGTTLVPPYSFSGDIFEFSSAISNLPVQCFTGSLLPATPHFNIWCAASSVQGDQSTHNSSVATAIDCEYKDDKCNHTMVNSPCHCLPNFGLVASNSEINYSNITNFTDMPNYGMYNGLLSPIYNLNIVMHHKYLHVMRGILSDVASYAVGDLSARDSMVCGFEREQDVPLGSSICREEIPIPSDKEASFIASTVGEHSPDEFSVVKENLVQMLKMIDQKYNMCLDQMQRVISEFHHKLDLDLTANICALFAHHAVSVLYKNLRDKISNQILLLSRKDNVMDCPSERHRDFESLLLQKQWAMYRMKSAEQPCWRPQRGLPEKSVSVLRKWLFQNFFHPYPKDKDKDLLAVKSGLTRNQVSNWFINARVRIWKPMIEQMYAELNKTSQHDDESTTNEHTFRGF